MERGAALGGASHPFPERGPDRLRAPKVEGP
jgi:hypothetical protein